MSLAARDGGQSIAFKQKTHQGNLVGFFIENMWALGFFSGSSVLQNSNQFEGVNQALQLCSLLSE